MRIVPSLLAAALAAAPASAAELPAYFKLPKQAQVDADSIVDEHYGEGKIVTGGLGSDLKRGRHYVASLSLPGVDDSTNGPMVSPFRTSLTGAGWVVVKFIDTSPPFLTLHYLRGGVDAWATLAFFGANDIRLEIVEIGNSKVALALTSPAATPEKVGEHDHFPYITPFPDSWLAMTNPEGGPFFVTPKGQEAPIMVSETSVRKTYSRPSTLSNLEFASVYRDAFLRAGWQVVNESRSYDQSDALVIARYVKGDRDVWASLHQAGEITITVADPGSEDWAARLQKQCRLALYGVNFDFNRATLRPDFEPTLRKATAVLIDDPSLTVEIQGHTDNVGGDADNLRLSQTRADAVKGWMVAHGVAASRLTSRGYGRNKPLGDNDTAEGRARNRRVELSRPGCR